MHPLQPLLLSSHTTFAKHCWKCERTTEPSLYPPARCRKREGLTANTAVVTQAHPNTTRTFFSSFFLLLLAPYSHSVPAKCPAGVCSPVEKEDVGQSTFRQRGGAAGAAAGRAQDVADVRHRAAADPQDHPDGDAVGVIAIPHTHSRPHTLLPTPTHVYPLLPTPTHAHPTPNPCLPCPHSKNQ